MINATAPDGNDDAEEPVSRLNTTKLYFCRKVTIFAQKQPKVQKISEFQNL
jgi:hypothetical protein